MLPGGRVGEQDREGVESGGVSLSGCWAACFATSTPSLGERLRPANCSQGGHGARAELPATTLGELRQKKKSVGLAAPRELSPFPVGFEALDGQLNSTCTRCLFYFGRFSCSPSPLLFPFKELGALWLFSICGLTLISVTAFCLLTSCLVSEP